MHNNVKLKHLKFLMLFILKLRLILNILCKTDSIFVLFDFKNNYNSIKYFGSIIILK